MRRVSGSAKWWRSCQVVVEGPDRFVSWWSGWILIGWFVPGDVEDSRVKLTWSRDEKGKVSSAVLLRFDCWRVRRWLLRVHRPLHIQGYSSPGHWWFLHRSGTKEGSSLNGPRLLTCKSVAPALKVHRPLQFTRLLQSSSLGVSFIPQTDDLDQERVREKFPPLCFYVLDCWRVNRWLLPWGFTDLLYTPTETDLVSPVEVNGFFFSISETCVTWTKGRENPCRSLR